MKSMQIILEPFVLASVSTGVNKNEEIVSYIDGVEIGTGFMASIRVVGQPLEAELKNLLGSSIRLVLLGVDFIGRDGKKLTIRCSGANYEVPEVVNNS